MNGETKGAQHLGLTPLPEGEVRATPLGEKLKTIIRQPIE